MDLVKRVEQILLFLRPVFSRQAAFGWFVLLFWSIVLVEREPAISSYVNALGLGEQYYHRALHWFQAKSWSVLELTQRWGKFVSSHDQVLRLGGRLVYLGDTTKIMKTGLKMPLVKRLSQQSQNVNKPKKIRGHHFGLICQLLGRGEARYGVPIAIGLHEGLTIDRETPQLRLNLAMKHPVVFMLLVWHDSFYGGCERTLVDQMIIYSAQYVPRGSIVVLDGFYAVKRLLRFYRVLGLVLITRMRSNSVAYAPFSFGPCAKGRGRPRKWGSKISLASVFAEVDSFEKATLTLYGRPTQVRYRTLELHWDTPYELVQIVWTQFPDGKQLLLLTNDLKLTGPELITAYSWRFKIEVSFRTLVHLLDGFAYRFWLKGFKKMAHWPKKLPLNVLAWEQQQAVMAKVKAFERFVTLHALVLGILQLLALEFPQLISLSGNQWFRTVPTHSQPTEQMVRLTLRQVIKPNFLHIPPQLLLHQFLDRLTPTKMEQHHCEIGT